MATREGSWWSRSWGALALVAFAIHLGATVYENAVVAPMWIGDPPETVNAWRVLASRPDSTDFFQALTAVVVIATTMAWMSGLAVRGWRRWWLSLSLVAAVALAAVTFLLVTPSERWLFGEGARTANDAAIVARAGEWLQAAAFRAAAILIGTWAMFRAQTTVAARGFTLGADFVEEEPAAPGRSRRVREFVFGDEQGPEITFGDGAENPRQRWRGSLPGHRRTAKK